MKKNEFIEIKKMDVQALKEKAKVIKKEIADLTIDKNINKMPNLKSIKNKRNELSKILTVFKQKQLIEDLGKQMKVKEEMKNGK